jgi:hypothetical protein
MPGIIGFAVQKIFFLYRDLSVDSMCGADLSDMDETLIGPEKASKGQKEEKDETRAREISPDKK